MFAPSAGREVVAMPVWGVTLVIAGAVLCCGLCAYGINVAIRRSKERRELNARAATH
jgi:hypothetical protein